MNVLVIFSDQQHKYAMGHRNTEYITPTLDALATEGVSFCNAYSPNPVCGPYRGCLMTGQLPSKCGVLSNAAPLPLDTETIAMAMKKTGYQTAYVGKYHLGGMGNNPIAANQRRGFDHFMGYQCYNGFDPNPPFHNEVSFFDENNIRHNYNAHRTDVTTDLTCDALREMLQKDKPFFMIASYQAPHYPEQPSAKYAALYQDTMFTLGDDYKQLDPYTGTESPPSPKPKENDPDYQRYGNDIQAYLRLYAGLCSQIDAGISKIISLLKEVGKYEDTLIIYTSDHGDMQGSHGMNNKCVAYEKSAGVPMVVRLPHATVHGSSSQLVSGVDIYPTVLDIANGTTSTKLDGVSWLPYLRGERQITQDYIISEFSMNDIHWRMVRRGDYKLICALDYTPQELYDLNIDPCELANLVSEVPLQDMVKELCDILKANTNPIMKNTVVDVMNT